MGTMAHSLVTEADTEYEAFLNYAKAYPSNCILLVDTYDVLKSGVPNAIKVAKEYLIPNGYTLKGIRIDSGDLAYLSKEAKKEKAWEFMKSWVCDEETALQWSKISNTLPALKSLYSNALI
mgnify:CR=1 FL=1